jgi:hypothetical protein
MSSPKRSYRGSWRREDNGYHQPRPLLPDNRTLPREFRDWRDNGTSHQITGYANAEPEVFGMRHELTFGSDWNRFDRLYFYRAFRTAGGVPSIDISNPNTGRQLHSPIVVPYLMMSLTHRPMRSGYLLRTR